jgi:uncharacterized protein involved in type VI secretion and phage assembly
VGIRDHGAVALSVRIGSAAAALIVCAWFALAAHTEHEFDRGQAIVNSSSRLTPAQLTRADAALHAAKPLNPDSEVQLALGVAALHAGRTLAAQRIFESVTRSEPENPNAWLLLAEAAYGHGRLLSRTVAQLARLDPLGSKSH